MRAMVFHGPDDLRAEELPVPRRESGELVLRIDAALTGGTGVKPLRRGPPVMIPKVPTVFGHELAGTVTAVGAGVRGVREGDRVVAANSAPCGACRPCLAGRSNLCEDLLFVNGAYGEFIALPPRLVATNVVPLGPTLPAVRAAFAEPLACALLGIDRARVESGQTVVVFGGCAPGTSIRLDTRRAHYEELTLLGAFHHTPELIRRAVDLMESGALVPDDLITHRMRLDAVRQALDLMARGDALKVLIEP